MNLKERIREAIQVKELLLKNDALINDIEKSAKIIVDCFKNGGKVLLCGNGGSAADAQHIAAELSGRFYTDRDPLFAEALHVNTSYLTAVANDYGYDQIFSRLVKAKGRSGDVLIGISTSGNSVNVLKAMKQAKSQHLVTIAFTGQTVGMINDSADLVLNVPSSDTARIQETHILLGHLICELVENRMFE